MRNSPTTWQMILEFIIGSKFSRMAILHPNKNLTLSRKTRKSSEDLVNTTAIRSKSERRIQDKPMLHDKIFSSMNLFWSTNPWYTSRFQRLARKTSKSFWIRWKKTVFSKNRFTKQWNYALQCLRVYKNKKTSSTVLTFSIKIQTLFSIILSITLSTLKNNKPSLKLNWSANWSFRFSWRGFWKSLTTISDMVCGEILSTFHLIVKETVLTYI